MAQGDAMVLRTGNLYSDYYDFEVDTNADGIADGWTATYLPAGATKALYATAPYHGTYSQRITFTTKIPDNAYITSDNIQLLGRSDLNARGHLGAVIAGSIYFKQLDVISTVQGKVHIFEIASDGTTVLETHHDSAPFTLTTAWALHSFSAAITNSATVYYQIQIMYSVASAPGADVLCDYLDTYETYTFAKNPSMPEQADVDRETKQSRLANRTLKSFTYPASGYKFSGKLAFGLISEAQMLALRSLWIWDKELTFTPNLNKLPASLAIRLGKKFDFNHVSPNLGAGYKGSLEWEEV
jgi:hypothetical protein